MMRYLLKQGWKVCTQLKECCEETGLPPFCHRSMIWQPLGGNLPKLIFPKKCVMKNVKRTEKLKKLFGGQPHTILRFDNHHFVIFALLHIFIFKYMYIYIYASPHIDLPLYISIHASILCFISFQSKWQTLVHFIPKHFSTHINQSSIFAYGYPTVNLSHPQLMYIYGFSSLGRSQIKLL